MWDGVVQYSDIYHFLLKIGLSKWLWKEWFKILWKFDGVVLTIKLWFLVNFETIIFLGSRQPVLDLPQLYVKFDI